MLFFGFYLQKKIYFRFSFYGRRLPYFFFNFFFEWNLYCRWDEKYTVQMMPCRWIYHESISGRRTYEVRLLILWRMKDGYESANCKNLSQASRHFSKATTTNGISTAASLLLPLCQVSYFSRLWNDESELTVRWAWDEELILLFLIMFRLSFLCNFSLICSIILSCVARRHKFGMRFNLFEGHRKIWKIIIWVRMRLSFKWAKAKGPTNAFFNFMTRNYNVMWPKEKENSQRKSHHHSLLDIIRLFICIKILLRISIFYLSRIVSQIVLWTKSC